VIVVFTKTEVQSSCALKVSVLKGCNKETQSSSEGLSDVRNIAKKGSKERSLEPAPIQRVTPDSKNVTLKAQKLTSARISLPTTVAETAASYSKVYSSTPMEMMCEPNSLTSLASYIGEGVDGCLFHTNGVELVVDTLANREQSMPNRMTVDRAHLTFNALGLRAIVDTSVRATLEDTKSHSAATIEVTIGIGVLFSQASLL